MAKNATHWEYEANAGAWSRARDVIAGEDAVKAAGEKYLPRLESQTDTEYAAYRGRASFFNATARTADGFVGLIFRRAPLVRLPGDAGDKSQRSEVRDQRSGARSQKDENGRSALARALEEFSNDADMLGTSLYAYAKNVVHEVIAVGRAGTLVDWEGGSATGQAEDRAYATMYQAEDILNWRTDRINGRNLLTLLVLSEKAETLKTEKLKPDELETVVTEQIRVLRLVPNNGNARERVPTGKGYQYQVEVWRPKVVDGRSLMADRKKREWELVETHIPLRRGKALPLIPFVFHGPRHSRPAVDKLPLADIISINLDHYRLDADYKHGVHFTALPTAWVSGFDKEAALRIGSSTAWITDVVGATAGFLEFTGQGLTTFERAMDRDERLMAVLGSRVLESQKRVGETAQAIELRQSGETSILSSIATSVSESLTQVMRWVYWWNATEELPDRVTAQQVLLELNTDYSMSTLTAPELAALVASWQAGAISKDTMHELMRKGEVLPDGRTNEEEARLIEAGNPKSETRNPKKTEEMTAKNTKGAEDQAQK